MSNCRYCGGNCENEPEDSKYLCDGFAGDIDGLYEGEVTSLSNLADIESLICDDIMTCCAGFGRTPAKDDRFVIALCQIIVDRFKEVEDE